MSCISTPRNAFRKMFVMLQLLKSLRVCVRESDRHREGESKLTTAQKGLTSSRQRTIPGGHQDIESLYVPALLSYFLTGGGAVKCSFDMNLS